MTAVETRPVLPMTRTCPFQPPEGYRELREDGVLTRVDLLSGQVAWVVTGYAEARALFTDARLSVNRSLPEYPMLSGVRMDENARRATRAVLTFVDMDEPGHGRIRRMLIPGFGVRQSRALRPELRRAADTALDRMARRTSAELLADYAVPMSAGLFRALFGVPQEDHEFIEERLRVAATDRMIAGQALAEVMAYFRERIAGGTAGGVLADLVAERVRTGQLSADELLNNTMTLIVSGNENLANALALAVCTLLAHPDELTRLRAQPELMPNAVEELLRYGSIADTVPRLALADIEIAGHVIRAGDGVILPTALLNRDEHAFPGADRLDLGRPARHHLAFGYGVHQCLGQHVVRDTLEVAITALFDRFPDLRLAVPVEDVPAREAAGIQGVTELPVIWGDHHD